MHLIHGDPIRIARGGKALGFHLVLLPPLDGEVPPVVDVLECMEKCGSARTVEATGSVVRR